MPAKDCTFLISYLTLIINFAIFITSFSRTDWVNFKYGEAGLWKECFANETLTKELPEEKCSNTAKANGPGFLEIARTFMILALVGEFVGLLAYMWFPPAQHSIACKDLVLRRLQELSYFIAGVFIMLAVVSYGMNYKDYYTKDESRLDVDIAVSFYLASVSAGLNIFFSIIMFYSRPDVFEQAHTKQQRLKKLNELKNKPTSDTRKDWLQNKKVPTPTDQKKKEDADANDEVVVKTSALKRIVGPSNVVLAFTRLKKGIGRKEEQEAIDKEEREIEYLEYKEASRLDDAENKYKGIFSVEDEFNSKPKPILSPPSSNRLTPTPTPRSVKIVTDTTSTSSSSSSSYTSSSDISSSNEDIRVTAADGAVLPTANAVAAAVEDTIPPRPQPTDHASHSLSNLEPAAAPLQQRQKVRRSLTTMQDNPNSQRWSTTTDYSFDNTKPNKLKPKRHLSHDAVKTEKHTRSKAGKKQQASSQLPAVPGKSIYNISTDGAHSLDNVPPPPLYEEVIGTHNHGELPQTVMTEQSKIYQPYSKR